MTGFSRDDTQKIIVGLVASQLQVDPERVIHVKDLEQLGADSLDMVELVMKMEDQFGMEINDDDAAALTSLDAWVTYVNGRRTK